MIEEPPEDTHIILTTSNPDQLLPTLLSRTDIIKIPPASADEIESYLSKEFEISAGQAELLARMSGGSPGKASYLAQSDLATRRDRIFSYFERVIRNDDMTLLIGDLNRNYSGSAYTFGDIRLDFEIMESIVHDLFISSENQLDKYYINIDIKRKLRELDVPAIESLEIWKECCADVKKSCLINNVSVNSAMIFFYISCAKAIDNPARVRLKLP